MKSLVKIFQITLLAVACVSLSGCDDPHVYGSIGVSSGGGYYGGYNGYRGGYGGPRINTSISVSGRIR